MMKNRMLVPGVVLIIAGIMMPFLTHAIAGKFHLSDIASGIMMGIGIGFIFCGSRMIVRYRKLAK